MPKFKDTEDRNRQRKRYYAKHRKNKKNTGKPYSEKAKDMILKHEICDVELSKILKRSVMAIQIQRCRLKSERALT